MAKLLNVETTKRGSRLSEENEYRATFDSRPEDEDVRQAQIAHGYHPGGYGGPSGIRRAAAGVWYCEHCQRVVQPEHVTHDERHDERAGGCGR